MKQFILLGLSLAAVWSTTVCGQDSSPETSSLADVREFRLSVNLEGELLVQWERKKQHQEQRERVITSETLVPEVQRYSVRVNGKYVPRTRKDMVVKQVQQPVTITMCVPHQDGTGYLRSPKLFLLTTKGLEQVTGTSQARQIEQEMYLPNGSVKNAKAFFVKTTADAKLLAETLTSTFDSFSQASNIRYVITTEAVAGLRPDEEPIALAATVVKVTRDDQGTTVDCTIGVPYVEEMTAIGTITKTVLQSEQRQGKTVQVPHQVTEKVPYTSSVSRTRQEQRTFKNPTFLTAAGGSLQAMSPDEPVLEGNKILVVKSLNDAHATYARLNQSFTELSGTIDTEGLRNMTPVFLVPDSK